MNILKTIIVIGGGPAGMMAAISASELGAKVILVEKCDKLGRKLLLTGKGRCNLTNLCGVDEFVGRFAKNGDFLRDAFGKFFNQELMGFFKSRGVALKVERQNRVFPESNRASSILKVLENELKKRKVSVVFKAGIKEIMCKNNKVAGVLFKNGKKMQCNAVILATGGVSYKKTGSTGDGYDIAAKLGHKIVSPRPGLISLVTGETFPKKIEGLVLKNIKIVFKVGKKHIETQVGELLFTNNGISGPLVISNSNIIVDAMLDGKDVSVKVDCKPGLSRDMLARKFEREFKDSPKKLLKNYIKMLFPKNFSKIFLSQICLDGEKMLSAISKKEIDMLMAGVKQFPMRIKSHGDFNEAMVTQGGVSLREVDPKTMQSKIICGLFFAGEILDLAGDTGGFNLQAAFSTGYLAGNSATYI